MVEDVFDQHGKLVAAEARGRVLRTQRQRAAALPLPSNNVACGVAHRVIDFLEAVEIEKAARRSSDRGGAGGG